MIESRWRSSKSCRRCAAHSSSPSMSAIAYCGQFFTCQCFTHRPAFGMKVAYPHWSRPSLMDPRYLALIPSVIVVFGIWAGFMVRSFLRGLCLPQCWRCGAPKVRRSRSDGFVDAAASVFLLRPFRCTGCRLRFFAPRFLETSRSFRKRATPSPARVLVHSPARHLQTQNQV
jgi:hypothetical protein